MPSWNSLEALTSGDAQHTVRWTQGKITLEAALDHISVTQTGQAIVYLYRGRSFFNESTSTPPLACMQAHWHTRSVSCIASIGFLFMLKCPELHNDPISFL